MSQCATRPARERKVCPRQSRMDENKPAHLLLLLCTASWMWVSHRSVVMIPLEGGLESRRDSRKRLCFIYVTVKIVLGLTYKIIIESWNTHASSSSQEALLCQAAPRVSREERERSHSVPLTLYQNKMQGVPSRGNIAIRRLPGDSAPLGVINTAVTRGGKEVHSRGGGGDRPQGPIPITEGETRLGQGPKSPHGKLFTKLWF